MLLVAGLGVCHPNSGSLPPLFVAVII